MPFIFNGTEHEPVETRRGICFRNLEIIMARFHGRTSRIYILRKWLTFSGSGKQKLHRLPSINLAWLKREDLMLKITGVWSTEVSQIDGRLFVHIFYMCSCALIFCWKSTICWSINADTELTHNIGYHFAVKIHLFGDIQFNYDLRMMNRRFHGDHGQIQDDLLRWWWGTVGVMMLRDEKQVLAPKIFCFTLVSLQSNKRTWAICKKKQCMCIYIPEN